MTEYASTEDVLRELGGTEATLKQRMGRLLWNGPVTSVTVDEETFDVPDTVLSRISTQLEYANGKVNSSIMRAYQWTPEPGNIPPIVRSATAQFAAYRSVTTDGVRPDYLRQMEADSKQVLADLRRGEIDLGIESPRPHMRKPAAYFSSGV